MDIEELSERFGDKMAEMKACLEGDFAVGTVQRERIYSQKENRSALQIVIHYDMEQRTAEVLLQSLTASCTANIETIRIAANSMDISSTVRRASSPER